MHELVEHEPTMSGTAEAEAVRILPERVANTGVLDDGSTCLHEK